MVVVVVMVVFAPVTPIHRFIDHSVHERIRWCRRLIRARREQRAGRYGGWCQGGTAPLRFRGRRRRVFVYHGRERLITLLLLGAPLGLPIPAERAPSADLAKRAGVAAAAGSAASGGGGGGGGGVVTISSSHSATFRHKRGTRRRRPSRQSFQGRGRGRCRGRG